MKKQPALSWWSIRKLTHGLALLLATVMPLAQAATTPEEVEEDQSLQSTLVTPHCPWGKNYQGGKVKALFIVEPGRYGGDWVMPGIRLREPVELIQRFDIEGDAFFYHPTSKFLGVEIGEQRARRLLENQYDVYVLANVSLKTLPAEMQFKIMEKVACGAGLLTVGKKADDFMVAKRQLAELPAWLNDAIPNVSADKKPGVPFEAYNLGKGRGVFVNYYTLALSAHDSFSREGLREYDYQMMRLGRALHWAAQREGRVAIKPLKTSMVDGVPCVDVAFTTAGDALDVQIAAEWHRCADDWRASAKPVRYKLSADNSTVTFACPTTVPAGKDNLPQVQAGRYLLGLIVRSKQGVEAYGAINVTVESPVGLAGLALDKTWTEAGGNVKATATLRGDTIPAGSVLRWEVLDTWGRILFQREAALTAPEPACVFTTSESCSIEMRFRATMGVNGRDLDCAEAIFTVPKRNRNQFNFLQWDTPEGIIGWYGWKQLRQAGQGLCLLSGFGKSQRQALLAASDIPLVPYSTRILDPKDENGYMKVGNKTVCWNDEEKIMEHVNTVVTNQTAFRQQGVFCYSLGDEGVTAGCCVHPECIKAYQKYLERQYGSIARLNDSWGEKYASFAEVALLDPKDNMESQAVAAGKFARWYDRQAFARWNLMNLSGRFVKAYKELDPLAVTGFEGTGGFGDDINNIISINTFYSPYPSIGDDILRSIADRSLIRANWMGYSKTGDALSDAAWRMVMKEMDSIWYWMWSGAGSYRGYLTPTLDFYDCTADLTREMKPVREGLGDLLMKLKPRHSRIAIYYSVPSAITGSFENGTSFLKPKQAHDFTAQFIYDLGLDFRYLTPESLRKGELNLDEFTVLLLPMTQALGADDVKAIRNFALNGGTVIADVRPGLYDDHGKPVPAGLLDDLFGVKRVNRDPATIADLDCAYGTISEVKIDGGIVAAGATAAMTAGDKPVLLSNKVGKGKAILLNFQCNQQVVDKGQDGIYRRFLDELLASCGVGAPFRVRQPDGTPLSFTEARVWDNGDSQILGVWWQMRCAWFNPKSGTLADPPRKAKITLPEKMYVYDLRAGKNLGRVQDFTTTIRQGRANFFLIQPYPIRGLDVKVTPGQPGDVTTAKISASMPPDAAARVAVLVEVTDPQGAKPDWGRRVLILENGRGEVSYPVAFNTEPGKWTVTAKELFSGKQDRASWRVK
ncbi:MAG TPA: beta-galactosidase trimerization domain-containing protein [Lentisphaeria bacterium]|nr:beta-galactosidase trimerization domain-containing protein [Lentisphaeria bacterium]